MWRPSSAARGTGVRQSPTSFTGCRQAAAVAQWRRVTEVTISSAPDNTKSALDNTKSTVLLSVPNDTKSAPRDTKLKDNRYYARHAVSKAIRQRKMPPAYEHICVICYARADCYHHHKGHEPENWFRVIPVCYACHNNIHRPSSTVKAQVAKRRRRNLVLRALGLLSWPDPLVE